MFPIGVPELCFQAWGYDLLVRPDVKSAHPEAILTNWAQAS